MIWLRFSNLLDWATKFLAHRKGQLPIKMFLDDSRIHNLCIIAP